MNTLPWTSNALKTSWTQRTLRAPSATTDTSSHPAVGFSPPPLRYRTITIPHSPSRKCPITNPFRVSTSSLYDHHNNKPLLLPQNSPAIPLSRSRTIISTPLFFLANYTLSQPATVAPRSTQHFKSLSFHFNTLTLSSSLQFGWSRRGGCLSEGTKEGQCCGLMGELRLSADMDLTHFVSYLKPGSRGGPHSFQNTNINLALGVAEDPGSVVVGGWVDGLGGAHQAERIGLTPFVGRTLPPCPAAPKGFRLAVGVADDPEMLPVGGGGALSAGMNRMRFVMALARRVTMDNGGMSASQTQHSGDELDVQPH
ncbi:hypothetical protein BJ165DRAFT_1402964 [Panaeolus papilionaceus]|nr:hypothetical protein BJ165DRAFT_1402964 [Panaeolus papilionaceus]